MNNIFIYKNIKYIIILLIQILIIDTLPLGHFYIMLYPCTILLMPVSLPRAVVIVASFVIGFLVDWFCNGNGFHTASLTMLGYFRYYLLQYLEPSSKWNKNDAPNLYQQGLNWFIKYISISILLHHSYYYFLESFSTHNLYVTFKKIFISTIISSIFIILINLFFLKNNKQ